MTKEDGTAQDMISFSQLLSNEKVVNSLRSYQLDAVHAANNEPRETLIVLPTGAGKSHVIAGICATNPGKKVLIISHVKEILEQNAEKLRSYVPSYKVGVYSCGLGLRQRRFYCVAGIQSIYKKPELFASYSIIIIDEAHMIPPGGEGRYNTFLGALGKKKIIGLTATPFRLKSGMLTDGPLFKNICYTAETAQLISQGYLCKLTSKAAETQLDVSDIKLVAGDYSKKQLSSKLDKYELTERIVSELVTKHLTRKAWLVFAIDIEHAEHINEMLQAKGVKSAAIHSKMDEDRSPYLAKLKSGELQCLVSIETLTTGFDAPMVDLIALLRPTQSPVLHVQMIGRGLRIHDNKADCLILDFAGNIPRLGPINNVHLSVSSNQKNKGQGEAPTKTCPECYEILPLAATRCSDCNYLFPPPRSSLSLQASSAAVIEDKPKKVQTYTVDRVSYTYHTKSGSTIPTLKVVYFCGLSVFKEFICFEHTNYPRLKAERWWDYRAKTYSPTTVQEAVKRQSELRTPTRIVVYHKDKYPEIIRTEF